jgi:hypothetical protein
MAYFPERLGLVSTLNSTESLLGSSATYTGTAEDVSNYSMITVFVSSDVDSAEKGLRLELSTDGTNWDRVKTMTVSNADGASLASGGVHTLAVVSKYFRVVYTNGGSVQTSFRLQTIYHTQKSKFLTSNFDQVIDNQTDVELTRSAIMGQDPAGNMRNVPIASQGYLQTEIVEPAGAFGDLRTADISPQIQLNYAYGLLGSQLTSAWVGVNSSAYSEDSMAVVSTSGTNTSANITSKRFSKYRPGQGSLIRYTGLFTTGVAGSTQKVGVFDPEDGFGFGYNGTEFGLFIKTDSVTTWTSQANWNVDVMDGQGGTNNPTNQSLDPTKGNVFQIAYQYLGFGMIRYYVENANTGKFALVHENRYANANTTPSLSIPTIPMSMEVINTSATDQIIAKSASMAAFTEGKDLVTGPYESYDSTKSISASTETNIFTIRGKSTFQGKPNRVSKVLKSVSVAADGNQSVVLKFVLNTTLGGTPSYTSIADESVVEVDVAGTTLTGGTVVGSIVAPKNGGATLLIDEVIYPGDTLTVSAESAASNTVTASLTWQEDF